MTAMPMSNTRKENRGQRDSTGGALVGGLEEESFTSSSYPPRRFTSHSFKSRGSG
jgi:hypothetical protein